MDENKKTPEEPKQGGIKGWINSVPYRSCLMMAIVGAYLIYLGYNLITSMMAGAEGSNIGFAAAGAAFMLYVACVGYTRYTKEKNAAAEAEKKEAESEQEEETDSEVEDFPEEEKPVQKKMSIAERAALANHLSDEEESADENTEE